MKPTKKKVIGKLKEAKGFSKDIVYVRCHAIMMKDEHGQVIYTFAAKEEADQFYDRIIKSLPKRKGKRG